MEDKKEDIQDESGKPTSWGFILSILGASGLINSFSAFYNDRPDFGYSVAFCLVISFIAIIVGEKEKKTQDKPVTTLASVGIYISTVTLVMVAPFLCIFLVILAAIGD